MTRALWVSAESPDRNLGGGSIRQAYLLEALGRQVETHLLIAGTLADPLTRSALAGVTEVFRPGPRPYRSRWRRRVVDLRRALVERESSELIDNRSARDVLAPALGGAGPFDVVCVEHLGLAPLLPRRRQGRWGLTLHNVASERAGQTAELAGGGRRSWLWRRQQGKARRWERWAVERYDVVFAVSDEDADVLPGPVVVIPNGVDTRRFRATPLPRQPRLVLTASLDYLPNVDGARWFCTEVLPAVQRRVPAATLDLVGRAPLPEVRALAALPGVRVHGDVPDVAPHLAAARVAVVPVRIGSGTRLKALEALASGRPLVGTSVGLAGLGLVEGHHALFADAPAAMAEAIAGLLEDDGQATRLAVAGRALAAERFDWESIGRRFVSALLGSQPVDGRGRRAPAPSP